MTRYRIKIDDAAGRWKAGEVGVEIVNDFPEKYDHKLYLGTKQTPGTVLFSRPLACWQRIFYFHDDEIEVEVEPDPV